MEKSSKENDRKDLVLSMAKRAKKIMDKDEVAEVGLPEEEIVERAMSLAKREMELAELERVVFTPQDTSSVGTSRFFTGMMDRVLSGWSPKQISDWVGRMGDPISPASIKRYVVRFVPPALVHPSNYLRKKFQSMNFHVDEIQAIEELVGVQYDRLAIDVQTEEGIDKLLPTTHKEVQTLAKLLHTSLRMKQSAGITSREPERVEAELTLRTKKESITGSLDKSSIEKLVSLAERVEMLSRQEKVLQEDVEDAEYEDEEEESED